MTDKIGFAALSEKSRWTHFWDMHSGGGQKEKWGHIFIQAPEREAKIIFYNRFGHNPDRVTCTCCGSDYSISEDKSLEQATAFERHCVYDGESNTYLEAQDQRLMEIREKCKTKPSDPWGRYQTLNEYLQSGDALAIYAEDIKDEERVGDVPQEGYVWV